MQNKTGCFINTRQDRVVTTRGEDYEIADDYHKRILEKVKKILVFNTDEQTAGIPDPTTYSSRDLSGIEISLQLMVI